MRFRFIEDRRADYPVTILCDAPGSRRLAIMLGAHARRASERLPIVHLSRTSDGSIAIPADAMAARAFTSS